MIHRKIKLFFMIHWVKLLIIGGVTTLLIASFIGLMSLESFYLKMTLAQLPVTILIGFLHAVIFAYVIISMQTGSLMKFRKDHIKSEDVSTTFNDVIGLEEAKRESMELVELIKDRTKVKKIGGKILRGILMIGAPGCGKTLLAKAIAHECGVPFISVAGSEFVEVFVGMGANRVRKLFKKARQLAYANGACIIFIDELDVIGRGRTYNHMGGGEETNSTQNQLLVEMDGLNINDQNVIVLGATNAEESILDKALLRPGRFDRKIYIDMPNLEERKTMFEYYLNKVDHDPQLDIARLAKKAVQKTPADIENIVKEAALISIRNKNEKVSLKEISQAMERIDMGVAHKRHMTENERRMVAYHETGHLMVLYLLHPTNDVFKVSIISRGESLGMVMHQPREELYTQNREQIHANIKVGLGGYAAEKIKFNTTSTGPSSDIKGATIQAYNMVWRLGMSDEGGLADYTVIPENQLSEEQKAKLNSAVNGIMIKCLHDVEKMLKDEWKIVEEFVELLLNKEELEYDEIEEVFKKHGKSVKKV